jgi:hypothetical protein
MHLATIFRTRRLWLVGIVLIGMLAAGGVVYVYAHHTPSQTQSRLGPQEIIEHPEAAAGSTSPQAAFTKSVTLLPCAATAATNYGYGTPAAHLAVSWIVADKISGIVLARAECPSTDPDPRPRIYLLGYRRDQSGTWHQDRGVITRQYAADDPVTPPTKTPASSHVPSWLPLPPSFYSYQTTTIPETVLWSSRQHIVVTGIAQQDAIRPAQATSLTVGGSAGWYDEENGVNMVVVPLSAGKTFFFASDISGNQLIDLANRAFQHLQDFYPTLP